MPTLEIITIGTELLLGEITDTNSTYIARSLRDLGIDIYRITTIGDNPSRISLNIQEALNRADIVITTGGLGPTVDDPTRQAVAEATGRELEFIPELWGQIQARFREYGRKPTENNRRQAFIPKGSMPIYNPAGTAPSFVVNLGSACVISLPGVPREMELILLDSVIPWLRKKYGLKTQIIKARVLHTASIGESAVDEIISDLEEYSNPTVGLLAHPGEVDIRITAKANSEIEALNLIEPVADELKLRLGEHIFGQDEETLESVVCRILNQNDLSLCFVEYGLEGSFIKRINLGMPDNIDSTKLETAPESEMEFNQIIKTTMDTHQCDISFGAALFLAEKVKTILCIQTSSDHVSKTLTYGGPRSYAQQWVQSIGLDFLRRNLPKD